MEYISEINYKDGELKYKNKFDIEQIYSIFLLIKIVNESEKDEKYYSLSFSFDTNEGKIIRAIAITILISLAIVIIIILSIFFFYRRKMKKKNRNFEDKVKAISFSSGIENDLTNKNGAEESKVDDEYENTFI